MLVYGGLVANARPSIRIVVVELGVDAAGLHLRRPALSAVQFDSAQVFDQRLDGDLGAALQRFVGEVDVDIHTLLEDAVFGRRKTWRISSLFRKGRHVGGSGGRRTAGVLAAVFVLSSVVVVGGDVAVSK